MTTSPNFKYIINQGDYSSNKIQTTQMRNRQKKYISHQTVQELHTGNLLTRYYEAHRTRKNALARVLNRHKNTIFSYEKNATIQTAILWEICHALKHNFFLDIACKLPAEFSTYAPEQSGPNEKIAALEAELQKALTERDVVMRMVKGA